MAIGPAQWDVAEKLFEETLRCPAGDRASYLERACPQDAGLRDDVLRMVALHEGDPDFLETPVVVQLLTAPLLSDGEVLGGRFRVVRRVGIGGMGEVYEAEDLLDPNHPERVALKVVRSGLASIDNVAARLNREIQLAHKITHPNVCKVHSLHVDRRPEGDRLFLVMDFLDGETLRERLLRTGAFDKAVALTLAEQIAAGLDEAHREGVVHKDLKSSNIMLVPRRDGTTRAVITDFSIADTEGDDAARGLGTLAYLAPERLTQTVATTSSDVYSFGVVLYEAVTGELPFDAAGPLEQRNRLPPAPSRIRRGLGRQWDRAILRCLRSEPGQRFAHAGDAAQALRSRWKAPAVAIAIALLTLLLGAALARPTIDWVLVRTATPAMFILPFDVSGGSGFEDGLLNYVAGQIQQSPDIRAKWLVFSPADARQHGVTTIEQALTVFGARHVLTGTVTVEGGSVTVAGQLLEAGTAVPGRAFTKQCSRNDVVCLQDGLVRQVAGVLDPETLLVQSAAFASHDAFELYLRGMEYLLRDALSYDQAMDFLQQAIVQDPTAVLPRIALADAHLLRYRDTSDRGELAKARPILEEALTGYPDLPQLQASIGNLDRLEGRYDSAERRLLTAIRADPSNHLFHRILANTYAAVPGREEEAIAAFQKVMQLQRRYWGGYHDYAVFLYDAGRYEEAIDLLESLIAWAPGHAQGLLTLGGIYVAQRRNDDAIRVSSQSCAVFPRRTCFLNLGIALQRQRQTEAAIDAYEQALAFPPTTLLFLNLADAHAFLNREREAFDYFSRCAKNAEDRLLDNLQDSGEQAILAYCLAQIGDRAGAMREIGRALQRSPDARSVQRYGVLTYESLGERELALQVLRTSTPAVLEELEASWGTDALQRDPRYETVAREVRNRRS